MSPTSLNVEEMSMPPIAAPSHFKQLRDWSERKHAILVKYLPAFCKASSGRGTIWYVDGYAGAGIYRDPNNPADPGAYGSPVLAAHIAQEQPYSIQCLNVEGDKENFESLQHETECFGHVVNIHADFNSVVDQVLARVARTPAFFFLDPFGTKDLPMEGLVDRVALRTKPTDLLLRYATETVRRLAGAYEKDAKRRDAHARNLDKWFRGQEWRMIVEQHRGPDRDEALLRYYLRQLVSISKGQLEFACAYPIRSNEGVTKYHVVFATGDRLGMKFMSDILFRADAKYEEDFAAHQQQKQIKKRNGQLSLLDLLTLDPDVAVNERIGRLKQSILEQGQQGISHWEFEDLLCTLIEGDWFAQFTEKDFRAACKEMYTDGRIERVSPGNGWSRGTEFVIRP
jgi:three-Cys-motif partner protein